MWVNNPGFSKWVECNHNDPYEGKEARESESGRFEDTTVLERKGSQAKGYRLFLKARKCKEMNALPEPPKEVQPSLHLVFQPMKLISDFRPLELCDNKFLLF